MDNLCFGSEVCPIPDFHILNCEYCPAYREKKEPEPVWASNQWAYIQQIKAEVLHYRKEHAKLMVELDKVSSLKKKKYQDYNIGDTPNSVTTVTD